MEKPYIRDPSGTRGANWTPEEDLEDFEQEQAIKAWLEREGRTKQFEFKHISRKGTARHTIDTRSVRLDAKVQDDEDSRTYADIVAGSDGRDLECRIGADEADDGPASAADRLDEETELFFSAIELGEETKQWVKKLLNSPLTVESLRSLMRDDEPLEISTINLELPIRLPSFRK